MLKIKLAKRDNKYQWEIDLGLKPEDFKHGALWYEDDVISVSYLLMDTTLLIKDKALDKTVAFARETARTANVWEYSPYEITFIKEHGETLKSHLDKLLLLEL